jgi:predicted GIY-YIG superfamily endonuclease
MRDDGYYIGCSSRKPEVRLKEHNSGMVKSTKCRRPLKIIYTETHIDKNIAFRREWFLKHPKGYQEKLNIINNTGQ